MKLKKFVGGFCVVIDDVFIRRREVVQFVANKAGGAHYDTDKTKPYQKAVDAMASYEVMGRGAVYYELLGIGQALASAPDTTRLVEELQQRPVAASHATLMSRVACGVDWPIVPPGSQPATLKYRNAT